MSELKRLEPQTVGFTKEDMDRLLAEKHRREKKTGRSVAMAKLIRDLVRESLPQ